jgi:hypothetical protein
VFGELHQQAMGRVRKVRGGSLEVVKGYIGEVILLGKAPWISTEQYPSSDRDGDGGQSVVARRGLVEVEVGMEQICSWDRGT